MSGISVLRLLSAARFKGTDAEAYFLFRRQKYRLGALPVFVYNLNLSEKRQVRKCMLMNYLSIVYKMNKLILNN